MEIKLDQLVSGLIRWEMGGEHVSPRARPREELAVGGTRASWPAAAEAVGSGGPQGPDVCVPVCLCGQDCGGVGYWGSRVSQPLPAVELG